MFLRKVGKTDEKTRSTSNVLISDIAHISFIDTEELVLLATFSCALSICAIV